MSSDDFYAPPSAEVYDNSFSDGLSIAPTGDLVTMSPLLLPGDLCVKCGETTNAPKLYNKKLYYTPQWTYLLIFLNLLIFIIGAMLARKALQAEYSVCQDCKARRSKHLWASAGAFALTLVLFIVGIANDAGIMMLIGFIGFVVALVVLLVVARPFLQPRKHKDGVFDVKAPAPFVAALRERMDGSEMW